MAIPYHTYVGTMEGPTDGLVGPRSRSRITRSSKARYAGNCNVYPQRVTTEITESVQIVLGEPVFDAESDGDIHF